MPSATSKLLPELRTLLQLTQAEAQLARLRTAQARTDAVRRELTQNAANADQRATGIEAALRDLGGVPNVVAEGAARAQILLRSVLEQAGPLSEGLLADLALEHQLLDRARYVKVLAGTAELPTVVRLAERLETAHAATVEWLTTVLAEDALGGPAAIRPTAGQALVGAWVRLSSAPVRYAAGRFSDLVADARHNRQQVQAGVEQAGATVTKLRDALGEVLVAGRDAGLRRAETVAREQGEDEVAETVHEARRDLGALSAAELPIRSYDSLTVADAVAAIKRLTEVEDVRAVLAYEEANKGRSNVVSAAQTQAAAIAKQAVA